VVLLIATFAPAQAGLGCKCQNRTTSSGLYSLTRRRPGAAGPRGVTPGPDRSPDGGLRVAGQVIEDDNVACAKRWTELLLDPLRESRAIDRLIEDEARVDLVAAQGGDESHRLPMAIRHFGMEPLAFGCPPWQESDVGLRPNFIDKDEARAIRPSLIRLPLLAPPGDLGPQLFGVKNAFFKSLTPRHGQSARPAHDQP